MNPTRQRSPARPAPSPPSLANRRFLTVAEIAAFLGISPRHVRNLIDAGRIEAVNVARNTDGPPRYRIPIAAYSTFVSSTTTA